MMSSKVIMYTLAAGSFATAMLLTVLYGTYAPRHLPTVEAEAPRTIALALDPAELTARAAVVYDQQSGEILFEKNGEERLPLASLTKLMSAQTILSTIEDDVAVNITQANLSPDGDWGFLPGEWWSVRDLVTFSLVASSNDAIAAAAGALGDGDVIAAMNEQARKLGLKHTTFSNSTGLDVSEEEAGAYGSAFDVALLTSKFFEKYPQFFEAAATPTVTISSGTRSLEAATTAGPLLSIPGLIGAKTGYTDLAGGNLVAAFDVAIGKPVIVVVLGSTYSGRFEDVKTLVEATRLAFSEH